MKPWFTLVSFVSFCRNRVYVFSRLGCAGAFVSDPKALSPLRSASAVQDDPERHGLRWQRPRRPATPLLYLTRRRISKNLPSPYLWLNCQDGVTCIIVSYGRSVVWAVLTLSKLCQNQPETSEIPHIEVFSGLDL